MRLALTLVIAAAFAASPALAKLPLKPVKIAVKHKEYEIDVTYPQTGNKAVDAAITSWAKGEVAAFKGDAASYDAGSAVGPDTLYIGFEVARNDDKVFSVVFTESIFEGGAHPNTFFRTMNFLMPDGWQVYLQEIFTSAGLKKISQLAVADLDRQLAGPDSMSDKDWIARGAGPGWDNFSDFVLLPDTLDIQYPPYAVAAYAAGPQETKIPLAPLKPFMRADWRAPAASFDCAKAAAPVEKTICSDVNLARRDRDVAEAYHQLVGNTDNEAAKTPVRDAQRAWLASRTARCGSKPGKDGVACLTSLYEARLKALTTPP
jgi:uncharacterized protein YecT (DUF1311 family)